MSGRLPVVREERTLRFGPGLHEPLVLEFRWSRDQQEFEVRLDSPFGSTTWRDFGQFTRLERERLEALYAEAGRQEHRATIFTTTAAVGIVDRLLEMEGTR